MRRSLRVHPGVILTARRREVEGAVGVTSQDRGGERATGVDARSFPKDPARNGQEREERGAVPAGGVGETVSGDDARQDDDDERHGSQDG